MKLVEERHKYWWNYLLERVWVPEIFDRTPPRIQYSTRLSKSAGTAHTYYCTYNLNYVLQEQGNYDETICHEVCHAFARRIFVRVGHDTLWRYLYNVVCKSHRGQYHDYKLIIRKTQRTESMKAVKELLRLQEKIAACESKPA